MALHPLELPREAALLFRVVVLQKRLLKALTPPTLTAASVTTGWVQQVWHDLDPEWVRRFCELKRDKRTQLERLQVIAAAPGPFRQALFDEFCRQNRSRVLFEAGGDFRDLARLANVDAERAKAVREFFKVCYARFSHSSSDNWPGLALPGSRSLCNRDYKDAFRSRYPTSVVCPYCDGEIGTPELDHYLAKSAFPLLACSPRNLVPVCPSCNDANTAKGKRPAITEGDPRSMQDWLHPFFRPASSKVCIRLTGAPEDSIPRLSSTDPAEQIRLDNHADLIRSLSERWTRIAASYFDSLSSKVSRTKTEHPAQLIDDIVIDQLDDHQANRGREASTLIKAAVCRAILDNRPGYREELVDSNPVELN